MPGEPTVALPPRPVRSIVVGTDFTPCSAVALKQAMRIAGGCGATLHVIHVIDITVVVEVEAALSDYQRSIREGLARDAEDAWRVFAADIPGAGALPFEVSINNRLAGILGLARGHRADLLVMGAFGDRRPDVGFGTVATACVRKSMSDVLLVRDTLPGPFRTVVAAVDFSATSARALERAAYLAAQDGADLHVVHAFSAPWRRLHYLAASARVGAREQTQYRDALERRLAEFVRPMVERYPSLRTRMVCPDEPGHRSAIVEYATAVRADLIALGTRGQTDLREVLLGSTAERVLDESRCSVLAVKPAGFSHPLAETAGRDRSRG